jgi:hypothetical protein
MPTWRICLLNSILFALLFIHTTTVIIRDVPVPIPYEGKVGQTTAASPSVALDEFLNKLAELKRHLPTKKTKGKHSIFSEETNSLLENLKNILAFLMFLDDLTEKMKPHRQNYRNLATFDNQFHARCDQSIQDIKVV